MRYLLFSFLSILPTVLSFFSIFEGNRERVFVLITLMGFFFLKLRLNGYSKFIKNFKLDSFLIFLIITSILSAAHIIFDPKPSSINYIDYIAPCILIISLLYFGNNLVNDEIERDLIILLTIWILIGIIELTLALIYGNSFCLPACIYYEWRPNASRQIQSFFKIDQFISLESLGLNSQEFSVVLGVVLVLLLDKMRTFISFKTFGMALIVLVLQIFSMSFTVFVAELLVIIIYMIIFCSEKITYKKLSVIFIFAVLPFFIWSILKNMHYLGFRTLSDPQYYFYVLFLEPLNFLKNLQIHEILFGIDKISYYPAENRWFVLVYRFGLLWFLILIFSGTHFFKKIFKMNLGLFKWNIVTIFVFITSVHNHLWHTISGTLIFSLLIVYLYYLPKRNESNNYDNYRLP